MFSYPEGKAIPIFENLDSQLKKQTKTIDQKRKKRDILPARFGHLWYCL